MDAKMALIKTLESSIIQAKENIEIIMKAFLGTNSDELSVETMDEESDGDVGSNEDEETPKKKVLEEINDEVKKNHQRRK